jgi:predicted histone-like DNA-binding protein
MAFYKKSQQKVNKKWYPIAITVGKPFTTNHIADRLAEISTVSRADTYAVLKDLGRVLGDCMAQGRSVRLEGLGTFRYTAITKGSGVDTAKEVSAKQIADVRVRFVPEIGRSVSGKVTTRSLVADEIIWVEYDGKAVPADPGTPETPETPGGGGGGDEGGGGYVDPDA